MLITFGDGSHARVTIEPEEWASLAKAIARGVMQSQGREETPTEVVAELERLAAEEKAELDASGSVQVSR